MQTNSETMGALHPRSLLRSSNTACNCIHNKDRLRLTVDESGMIAGDLGWVQSYADIQDNRIWLGENVIKLDEDSYWAFSFSGHGGITMAQVKNELRKGYIKTKHHEPTGEMLGMRYNTDFFNVAFIGMDVSRLDRLI